MVGRSPAETRRKAAPRSLWNFLRSKTVRPPNRRPRRKRLTSQIEGALELAASRVDITTSRPANICGHAGVGEDFLKLQYAQFIWCFELDSRTGIQSDQVYFCA